MLVRAKEAGFHGRRIRPGETFEYEGKLGKWMEPAEAPKGGRKAKGPEPEPPAGDELDGKSLAQAASIVRPIPQ